MRLRSTLLSLALASGMLLTGPLPAARADVGGRPAPLALFTQASDVFVGKVTSVGKTTMEVEVLDLLKGTAKGTVELSPIYEATCLPGRDDEREPMYAAGQRILVAAVRTRAGMEISGNRLGSQDLGDDAGVARAVAFAKEMLRIAALPDSASRRAAMAAHLMSPDPTYLEAVQWFQFSELKEPAQTRPHAPALIAALRAPLPLARKIAARALVGVAAPEAFERLVEMTADPDLDTARDAAAAVAAYDTDAAVEAIVRAAGDRRDGGARRSILGHLALSPRPVARATLCDLLHGPRGVERSIAYHALGRRITRVGTSEADEDELLGVVRRGDLDGDNPGDYAPALEATRSVRVAKALIEVVRDPRSGTVQRAVACRVLSAWTTHSRLPGALELIRADEALFIARLDEGGTQHQLFFLLREIHTKAARQAVERAAESHPDEGARADARRTLESWRNWVNGK